MKRETKRAYLRFEKKNLKKKEKKKRNDKKKLVHKRLNEEKIFSFAPRGILIFLNKLNEAISKARKIREMVI